MRSVLAALSGLAAAVATVVALSHWPIEVTPRFCCVPHGFAYTTGSLLCNLLSPLASGFVAGHVAVWVAGNPSPSYGVILGSLLLMSGAIDFVLSTDRWPLWWFISAGVMTVASAVLGAYVASELLGLVRRRSRDAT